MGRLLAYLGAPVDVGHLVYGGEHSLYAQSRRPREQLGGRLNADGYGVVWYSEDGPARIAEPRPIWHDDGLARTLGALRSGCVFAAVRSASEGAALDRTALCPLLFDGWAFALNGAVPDFRRAHMRALRADLPDELYAELGGASDAETLFLLVVSALREGVPPVDALRQTANLVLDRVGRTGEAQLNMVLTDGARLVAVRTGSRLETNSLYVSVRPPFAPDGVVLASEAPEAGAAWSAVDGHSWIEVAPDGSTRSEVL